MAVLTIHTIGRSLGVSTAVVTTLSLQLLQLLPPGNVFFAMNRVENALAMYDKVVDIWYKCLASVLAAKADGPAPMLSEAKGSEGIEMLSQVS